jgi:hypothetical protein
MLKSYKLLGYVGTNKISVHARNKAIFVIIAVVVAISVLLAVVIVLGVGGNISDSQRKSALIDVSNVRIDSGVQPGAFLNFLPENLRPIASYTIKNLHNVDVTTVGLSVDGTNYGQSSLLIPPGKTISTSTTLNNAVYSSRTYNIELTFTFTDGTHETYSTSYKTPFSQAQIARMSLTLGSVQGPIGGSHATFSFDIEVQNTGDVPIGYAKGTVGGLKLISQIIPMSQRAHTKH